MIKKLLQTIINNSISGDIIWSLTQSCFNNDTSYEYECKIGDTSIKVRVELNSNLTYNRVESVSITNSNLINGVKYLSGGEDVVPIDMGGFIYKVYIKPNLKFKSVKTEDQVLEEILLSIPTKAESRDNKIDDILKPSTFVEVISDSKKFVPEIKEKGFFKKFFK